MFQKEQSTVPILLVLNHLTYGGQKFEFKVFTDINNPENIKCVYRLSIRLFVVNGLRVLPYLDYSTKDKRLALDASQVT